MDVGFFAADEVFGEVLGAVFDEVGFLVLFATAVSFRYEIKILVYTISN